MMEQSILSQLISMSRAHIEDIQMGLQDGFYDILENPDLHTKLDALVRARAIYRRMRSRAEDSCADPGVKVRSVNQDGAWVEWNITLGITDRWGEIEEPQQGDAASVLVADEELLEDLRFQMWDSVCFIARKDGHYGVLFEVEYASRESEASFFTSGVSPDSFAPHDEVVSALLAALKPLAERFPGVELCVPHESEIPNDRPAVWAWVSDGLLDAEQRGQLGMAVLNLI